MRAWLKKPLPGAVPNGSWKENLPRLRAGRLCSQYPGWTAEMRRLAARGGGARIDD